MKALTLCEKAGGICDLVFDLPGEKVNKLSSKILEEFNGILDELEKRKDLKVLRILSSKEGIFIAGADISEIENITDSTEAETKAKAGQDLFNRIENLPFVTLAVINGACLGGGMELALACDFRMATTHSKVRLGLPEVNLGILPGFGGTQRLPRLIGLQNAMELILSGRAIDGRKAFKKRLVDTCVAWEFLEQRVEDFTAKLLSEPAKRKLKGKREKNFSQKLLENNPIGRKVLFDKALESLIKKSGGHYPAPIEALEVLRKTYDGDFTEGLKRERQGFGKLAPTRISKNLIQVFYTSEALKKETWGNENQIEPAIDHTAVLGAGIMGGGIAWLMSDKEHSVRMKDLSLEAIQKGYESAARVYEGYIKRKRLKPTEVSMKMNRISSTLDFRGFHEVELCIEAVVENLEVKQKVLAEAEGHLGSETILASNTSSLSIDEMSRFLKRPANFLGMHFFNPVHRMPLVEIIPGSQTSPAAISRLVQFTRHLGKTPVVVKNVPGFLVNRILIPYMVEAALCFEETGNVQDLDRALERFGMPMGPFVLADEVGIDVGAKVSHILEAGYGERMKAAGILDEFVTRKYLGKKSKQGFYRHTPEGKREIYPELTHLWKEYLSHAQLEAREVSLQERLDRCVYQLINEAAKCLDEEVIASAPYLDMAMIMGTGFPPFKGGPLAYADEVGLPKVYEKLLEFKEKYGIRFEPAEGIARRAQSGETFYTKK